MAIVFFDDDDDGDDDDMIMMMVMVKKMMTATTTMTHHGRSQHFSASVAVSDVEVFVFRILIQLVMHALANGLHCSRVGQELHSLVLAIGC